MFYSFEHKITANPLTFNIASINPLDGRNQIISSVVTKDKVSDKEIKNDNNANTHLEETTCEKLS